MATAYAISSSLQLAAEEDNPVVPVVGELIIGFIAFGVLCFILLKYVFPKMEQMYAARVEAIEGGLKRAEVAQAQAQDLLAQYQAQLAEARTEATAIRDEAREEGQRILADLREKANEEAGRIVARGEQQLATQRQQLITEMRGEIGQLSVELASRIIGETLADDVRRAGTVERFLGELESVSAAASDATGSGRR